jgi:vacuolar-type H+-ATPase subunit H
MNYSVDRLHLPSLNQDKVNYVNSGLTLKEIQSLKVFQQQQQQKKKKKNKARMFEHRILPEFERRVKTNTQSISQNRHRRKIAKLIL